jgi:hypothetical protein
VLLDPPGWPGRPQGLPPLALCAGRRRGPDRSRNPPSIVRADIRPRERGLTTFYALLGLGPHDVLLHTVLSPITTIYAVPEDVAGVAEEWARHRRLPEVRHRREWDGAHQARAAAVDFCRNTCGLSPAGVRMGEEITKGEGVQLNIDTQQDTYEQAIAAVQAAYGLNPAAVAGSWPDAPAVEAPPGPESLSSEEVWQGWTDRLLFDTLAAVMPGARAVLRRVVEVGGTATYDDIREHFIDHPATPIPRGKIGGALTSVRAVRRRIGPDNRTNVLELDDRARVYRIEPALVEGLKRAFDLAEARPDLLRRQPAGC